jgi:hypothetical protein
MGIGYFAQAYIHLFICYQLILPVLEINPILTIQLLPQFDFGHRTPKPGIFDHPTLKTVHNGPWGCFDG